MQIDSVIDISHMCHSTYKFCVSTTELKNSSSVNMEQVGLIRALLFLAQNGIDIGSLVTYRHPPVRKYMRNEIPDTQHFYDI